MYAYAIDYSFSDLSEDEIAVHIAYVKEQEHKEREEEARRMEKARTFRFTGGLC